MAGVYIFHYIHTIYYVGVGADDTNDVDVGVGKLGALLTNGGFGRGSGAARITCLPLVMKKMPLMMSNTEPGNDK
jgi:hypothetical protein